MVEFLKIFSKPGGIYQQDVDKKESRKGKKKNAKINRKDADTN
jgi:hypothetical protein